MEVSKRGALAEGSFRLQVYLSGRLFEAFREYMAYLSQNDPDNASISHVIREALKEYLERRGYFVGDTD